jgi:hypothetical protein
MPSPVCGTGAGREGLLKTFFVLLVLFGISFDTASSLADTKASNSLTVRFSGDGFYDVEMDGYGRIPIDKPHWPVRAELPAISPDLPEFYRQHGAPIVYIQGSTPLVTLASDLPDSAGILPGTGLEIEGRGPRGICFVGTALVKTGDRAGRFRIQTEARAEKALPGSIETFEPFDITWTARQESGKAIRIGVSRSVGLYTLRTKPRGPLLHTPVRLAALQARGLSEENAIIQAIWKAFAQRDVRRARDGLKLSYYGGLNDSAPAELRRMLIAGTGQCVAWSYLLYATLGSQGISSDVTMIVPPDRGRIFVGNWHFQSGTRFIDTGADGICQTEIRGDDVVLIRRGQGLPCARLWTAQIGAVEKLSGDDTGNYNVGPNGIADTTTDETAVTRLIPHGFGLECQRAYMLKPDAHSADVRLGGDDTLSRQINTTYVTTGPNGILETERQDDTMQPGRATGSTWDPKVGSGATSIRVEFALPKASSRPRAQGDDGGGPWWIDTGKNGVFDSASVNLDSRGKGAPFAVAIGVGPNGKLDSLPGGDDQIRDLKPYLALAPTSYTYVSRFSLWPPRKTEAQQNATPPPDYPNHMILKVQNRYYDPSYGRGPFETPLEWERASLSGVGVRIQENGQNVRFQDRILTVVRRSDGRTQLTAFMTVLPPD